MALTVDGELVADFWGGFVDQERTRPWERDTIVNVWSTTKTMTSLAALVLADRGQLDLDAPVATYWPEFAANGKEGVLVRHLMSHTSGVSGWAQPVVQEDIYDPVRSVAMLAAQAPWWEPGTASGLPRDQPGAPRRRGDPADHRSFARHVLRRGDRRPVARRLLHRPAGAEHDPRVSPVIPPPPLPFDMEAMDPDSPVFKTFTGPPVDANHANTEAWRRAEIGAANGHGNARSVARIQSVVANGGTFDGVTLLSPATIERIFEVQSDGVDLVLGMPLRFGIGYGLPESRRRCRTCPTTRSASGAAGAAR